MVNLQVREASQITPKPGQNTTDSRATTTPINNLDNRNNLGYQPNNHNHSHRDPQGHRREDPQEDLQEDPQEDSKDHSSRIVNCEGMYFIDSGGGGVEEGEIRYVWIRNRKD